MIIDNFLNIHYLCVRDTQVMNQQYPLSFTSESECLMWLLQTIRPVAQSLVAHYCSLHISIHTYMHVCMYARAQMSPHEWTFAELRIHASTVVCMCTSTHMSTYASLCMTCTQRCYVCYILYIIQDCMIDIILAFSCALAEMICSCTLCETYGYIHQDVINHLGYWFVCILLYVACMYFYFK